MCDSIRRIRKYEVSLSCITNSFDKILRPNMNISKNFRIFIKRFYIINKILSSAYRNIKITIVIYSVHSIKTGSI